MRTAVTEVDERRSKFRVETKIRVKVGDVNQTFSGNLSKSGVFLETSDPFAEVGEKLQMQLILPHTNDSVKITGKVVRVTGPHRVSTSPGMGIEFLRVEARQARTFQRFIDHLLDARGLGSRRYPRIKAQVSVELRSRSDVKQAISENVSKGGLFLKIPAGNFTLGDTLKVVISHAASKKKFECNGRIVHLRKGESIVRDDFIEGVGVEFINLSSGRENEMARFLRALVAAKRR